jgi:hypothetical protein
VAGRPWSCWAFRNRGKRANYLNRYRVRAGLRSRDPAAAESVLILCGGAVAAAASEADLMARYARDELGYSGPLLLDRTSASTWENIANALPLIGDADTVKIVSNSLHAEKGGTHLWKQDPELGGRLARGSEHRFGNLVAVSPMARWRPRLRPSRSEQTCGALPVRPSSGRSSPTVGFLTLPS